MLVRRPRRSRPRSEPREPQALTSLACYYLRVTSDQIALYGPFSAREDCRVFAHWAEPDCDPDELIEVIAGRDVDATFTSYFAPLRQARPDGHLLPVGAALEPHGEFVLTSHSGGPPRYDGLHTGLERLILIGPFANYAACIACANAREQHVTINDPRWRPVRLNVDPTGASYPITILGLTPIELDAARAAWSERLFQREEALDETP